MPSSSVRSTSVCNPRMVRVTSATMISISPRVNGTLPSRRLPTRAIRRRLRTRFQSGAQLCRPTHPCRGATQSTGAAGYARSPAETPLVALCRLRSATSPVCPISDIGPQFPPLLIRKLRRRITSAPRHTWATRLVFTKPGKPWPPPSCRSLYS
jgi:hypothetical protein